jgi:hypothetical protein
MKQRRYPRCAGFAILIATLAFGLHISSVDAQDHRNTVTFDNRSGEPALVKLIGPIGQTIEVPDGQSRTVNVAAGEYYLLARYGSDPNRYTYSRGDRFTVGETARQYSAITITLHKVVGGNYPTRPTSAQEFDKAIAESREPQAKQPQAHAVTTPKTEDARSAGATETAVAGAEGEAPTADGQPVLAVQGKPVLTVAKTERLTQFVEQQNRKVLATPGYEFIRVYFVAKWPVKAEQDPCDALAGMRDPRTATRPGDYVLVDNGGKKVVGWIMEWTWVAPPDGAPPAESCAFTVLFQESPAGSNLVKIRLNGAEADISMVSGARGAAKP